MKTPEVEVIEAELGVVRLLRTSGRSPEIRAVAAKEESRLVGRLAGLLQKVVDMGAEATAAEGAGSDPALVA